MNSLNLDSYKKEEQAGSKNIKNSQAIKTNKLDNLINGLAISATISGYIFGPLVFFGLIGFFLDKYFGSGKKILIIAIGVAFITSNILIFLRTKKIVNKYIK